MPVNKPRHEHRANNNYGYNVPVVVWIHDSGLLNNMSCNVVLIQPFDWAAIFLHSRGDKSMMMCSTGSAQYSVDTAGKQQLEI